MPSALRFAPGFAILALSCGPSPTSKPVADPGANVAAKNLTTPIGVALTAACVPTGAELCFNAVDDNCNGVIDEGCGTATGILQFTVAWGSSPADVDLVLRAPNKDQISDANRNTSAGFHLDHDCPTDGCGDQNIENVYFDGADPPHGRYSVDVKLVDLKTAETPVKIRFGARIGARTYGADLELSQPQEKKTFAFDL